MIAICLLNVIIFLHYTYRGLCTVVHMLQNMLQNTHYVVSKQQYSMHLQQLIMTGVTNFSYLRPIANELELLSFESNLFNYSLMPINSNNSNLLLLLLHLYYTYACFKIMLFTWRNIFTPVFVVLFIFKAKVVHY